MHKVDRGDDFYMEMAIQQAYLALEAEEIPVGAVIICEGKVIAKAHNQTLQLNDPTAHAEMLAITSASHYLSSRYLNECTLYVTLEPCSMCAGASNWAMLGRIVYGASDKERGYQSFSERITHKRTEIVTGVRQLECEELLKQFFEQLRSQRKK